MSLSTVSRIAESSTAKIMLIGLLTVALFVPLAMVWALTAERAGRRDDVEREVSGVWGGRQTVGGMALVVPFDTLSLFNGVQSRSTRHAIVLPVTLTIDATLTPEVRRRSIFTVNLYRSTIVASGAFERPDFARLGVTPDAVHWDRTEVHVGIADPLGTLRVTPLSWGASSVALEPAGGSGPFGDGLRAVVPVPPTGEPVPFRLELEVAGSGSLMFLPSGEDTRVVLRSPWPSPGFTGGMLPTTHEIGPGGFQAEWRSNFVARPFPQRWIDDGGDDGDRRAQARDASFGVDLVTTVDHYQRTERAVKYGFLFIALTFAVFLVWEVLAGLRLHPVQYLLVGLAMVVFYLLLLSLAEQVVFGAAYATASGATVLLVGGYAARILGRARSGAAIAGWLGVLYGLLFALLQLEDLALLVGSVAVFLALAALMHLTRNVDWYGRRDTAQ